MLSNPHLRTFRRFGFLILVLSITANIVVGWFTFRGHPYIKWKSSLMSVNILEQSNFATNDLQSKLIEKPAKRGHPHTSESKAKISAANKGKASWNTGQKHSEETRRRIAESTKIAMQKRKEAKARELGMTLEEYDNRNKKEASESSKKNITNKGGLTPEGRKRISDSLKKRWEEEGYREMYRLKVTGNRNHSNETRARIAEKIREKWMDADYRAKISMSPSLAVRARISATLKSRWNDPDFRARMMHNSSFAVRTDEWRQAISKSIIEKWRDPTYRSSVMSASRIFNRTGSFRRRPVQVRKRLDPEEVRRLREESKLQRQEKRRVRNEAIRTAKQVAQTKIVSSGSIKDILGSELWFEEKLRRKKDGADFLSDAELEAALIKEWKKEPRKKADKDIADGDDEFDMTLEESSEDEQDDLDAEEHEELIDDIMAEMESDEELQDVVYGGDFDSDLLDDDIIEVYDERGELIGRYTATEFAKLRGEA